MGKAFSSEAGNRCQRLLISGRRCQGRAFARVRIVNGFGTSEIWLCGAHQSQERRNGGRVTMLEKWSESGNKIDSR